MTSDSSCKELRLAKEYKYLLSNIRPLIEKLDRSKDAQLCLLWLSKLDQCSRYEKCERNDILSELSRQVKNKCLEPPFNSQPPPGPLKNVVINSNNFSDDMSSGATTDTRSPFSTCSTETNLREQYRNRVVPWRGKSNSKNINVLKPVIEKEDHSQCLAIQKKYHNKVVNDQLLIQRYQEIMKALITQKFKNAESSSLKFKSLKSSYESKISDLSSLLSNLEQQNSELRQKLLTSVVPDEKLREIESKNAEFKEKMVHLEVTNNRLELKCRDLEKEKCSALSELASKLNETEKRLKECENEMKAVEKKHEETLCEIKTLHQAEVDELEKKYTCELSALEHTLEEKQNEISSLREQVSTQCLHFEKEVMRLKRDILQDPDFNKDRRKIKFLKSKLKKFEKIQENMAMAFQTQLQQMVARKDYIISTLEMKLNVKSADSSGNGKGCDLDGCLSEKICLLENQYRKLLEESENQAAERRQIDLQKILVLENQLINNGCGMQELNSITYPENLMLMAPKVETEPVPHVEEK